ncbi:MAG: GTP cyclohydrolase II [Deltaproteobacteria bacterium]|nr:GTP cyclohydrolase II [Deltaproteobacteria bacterium]
MRARSTATGNGRSPLAPDYAARAFLHAVPRHKSRVELYSEAVVPTKRGDLRMVVFREYGTGKEHVATVKGEVNKREGVLVRVHSECLTSEIMGSLKCDCREQLEHGLDAIAAADAGILLYLRQEGRGIGLGNKIRAYALQNRGADTYEANRKLGFADDLRRYDIAAEMLEKLGVRSIDLITNNPLKVEGLASEGVAVRRRVPSPSAGAVNPHNLGYLKTKRERTGHLIELLPAAAEDGA